MVRILGNARHRIPVRRRLPVRLYHGLVATIERDTVAGLHRALCAAFGAPPEVAVFLGSGWREGAAGLLDGVEALPLAAFPGWPRPRVPGHAAELAVGLFEGRRVAFCGGRVHAYEGYPARDLVRGVRALARWGCPAFVLLNAAGSLREDLPPGTLLAIRDHINLGLPNPLAADQSEDGAPLFLDLVDLYDPAWRGRLLRVVPELREGVYAGLPGPSYETPAEVRHLAGLGADAAGMSTIPEAIAARAAGARVLAVSFLSNFAAGLLGSRPSHGEVLAAAAAHAAAAGQVLAAALRAERC